MRISDWSSDGCSSDLITNGANCAVASGTAGNALGANSFVNFVNNTINTAGIDVNGNGSVGPGQGDILPGAGLQGTTPFPANGGIASTGAFSICKVLEGFAAAAGGLFDPNGIEYFSAGVPVNIKGNNLPQAPNYQSSPRVQYTARLGSKD